MDYHYRQMTLNKFTPSVSHGFYICRLFFGSNTLLVSIFGLKQNFNFLISKFGFLIPNFTYCCDFVFNLDFLLQKFVIFLSQK